MTDFFDDLPPETASVVPRQAWRAAAIYRCCLRHGMGRAWAMSRMSEAVPERDHRETVENWFTDMEYLRARRADIPTGAHARGGRLAA